MTDAKVTFDNVADAKTAKEAAERTQAALQDLAEQIGFRADEVKLDTHDGIDGAYRVTWGGLYKWTVALTGGESAVSYDLGTFGGMPEILGLDATDNWMAEPKNGRVLVIFPN